MVKHQIGKETYQCLNHSNSLRPKRGYSINKIQSWHISQKNSLNGIVDCTICSSSTYTCAVKDDTISGSIWLFLCHYYFCDIERQTCNEQQLVQGWVAHHITFSKFHEQQQCPSELHGQAILDTECEEQIMVAPQTAAMWDDFSFVTTNHKD